MTKKESEQSQLWLKRQAGFRSSSLGVTVAMQSILRVGFYVTLVTNILRRSLWGTSLVVQGLGFCLPMQGVQFPSLVGELRPDMPLGQKTKTANRNNIVTNLIKTFKKYHF